MTAGSTGRPGGHALAALLAGSVVVPALVIVGMLAVFGYDWGTETAVTALAMAVAATWLGIATGRMGPGLVTGAVFAGELGAIVRALGGGRLLLYGAVGFEIIALAAAPAVLARVGRWPFPRRLRDGRPPSPPLAALAGLLAPLVLAAAIFAAPGGPRTPTATPPAPPDAPS